MLLAGAGGASAGAGPNGRRLPPRRSPLPPPPPPPLRRSKGTKTCAKAVTSAFDPPSAIKRQTWLRAACRTVMASSREVVSRLTGSRLVSKTFVLFEVRAENAEMSVSAVKELEEEEVDELFSSIRLDHPRVKFWSHEFEEKPGDAADRMGRTGGYHCTVVDGHGGGVDRIHTHSSEILKIPNTPNTLYSYGRGCSALAYHIAIVVVLAPCYRNLIDSRYWYGDLSTSG